MGKPKRGTSRQTPVNLNSTPVASGSNVVESSSEQLDKKRRRERMVKLNLEEIADEILRLVSTPDNAAVVGSRLRELSQVQDEYFEIRNQILDLIPDDKVDEELLDITACRRKFRHLADRCSTYVEENTQQGLVAEDSDRSSNSGSRHETANAISLPKLSLPKFSGEILEFNPYWEQFQCAVHENQTLSDVQKFVYLRSTLEGSAMKCIEGFEVTAGNYAHAVEAIRHRFGRTRLIAGSLVKSVIGLESRARSAREIRELYDTLQNRIRALQALGLQSSEKEVQMLIIPILEMKLSPELAEKWELHIEGLEESEVTIEAFFKFLHSQVISKEARERTGQGIKEENKLDKSHGHGKSYFKSTSRSGQFTAASLVGTTSPDKNQRKVSTFSYTQTQSCRVCGKPHDASSCLELIGKPVEQRWETVKLKRLCFNCLRPTNQHHNVKSCRAHSCTIEGCGKKHHRLLHNNERARQEKGTGVTTSTFASSSGMHTSNILLQTAQGTIELKNGTRLKVRVLFDPGSQRSYIRKRIADSLGIQGPTETLIINTLGGNSTETKRYKRIAFSVQDVEVEALAIPEICAPLGNVNIELSKYPHLAGLELADFPQPQDGLIDVLIGADYYYSLVQGAPRKGKPGTPTAVQTKLGWVLCGPVDGGILPKVTTAMFGSTTVGNVNLKDFWDLESIGITPDKGKDMAPEEKAAVSKFEETISFDGNRYTVGLPWKAEPPPLKDNYVQALRRLESTERKLQSNPKVKQAYSEAIEQYISAGFAEKVEVSSGSEPPHHYLPHHAVIREDKTTTKTRIVFDASAKDSNGVALNDCIHMGPALQPNLVGVLLRFRMNHIAVVSDVKKMFLQINLKDEDREFHRFLWRQGEMDRPPDVYRMKRVTFGVNASPFLAIATVHHHCETLRDKYPTAAEEIRENMYVDDCLSGTDDTQEAIELRSDLKSLMQEGGFELTKWASNSAEVMKSIPPEERESSSLIDLSKNEPLKTLGIGWDVEEDNFIFTTAKGLNLIEDPETKRSLLSIASKVYDPMGLLSPYVIRAKLLFQELWQKGIDWDDKLEDSIRQQWKEWKDDLPQLDQLRVPRCLPAGIGVITSIELHGFGDASEKAYGAACYLRMSDAQGRVVTRLIMSKSRVAPVKKVSLPRLELLAAVVNTRLVSFVHKCLGRKIDKIVLWSDSMVTLAWIKKPSHVWKTFVANRVEEIQSTFEPSAWRYCPGVTNPSDLLTRGLTTEELIDNDTWWNGPQWLKEDESEWPCHVPLQESKEEMRHVTQSNVAVTEPSKQVSPIDAARYSSWSKLMRVTACVRKAVKIWKAKIGTESDKQDHILPLRVCDIRQAKLYWYRIIQESAYQLEIEILKQKKPLPRKSRLLKLDPYLDEKDQVLRVGGRLQNTEYPEARKHPIILPHHHPLVEKVIMDSHVMFAHPGPETVLANLRLTVWITKGRSEVKRVTSKCQDCIRDTAEAFVQKMGVLPPERVNYSPAFTVVGVDFAGPLYVITIKGKERTEKAYICLFTCATSRMVHLECVLSMTCEDFLQALRRMTNRRGLCQKVWSDNAKTFKKAEKVVIKLFAKKSKKQLSKLGIDTQVLETKLAERGIEWKYIVERAPWRGGWWERLVRSTKESLRRVLGKARLTYPELCTVLTDVEATINSRPLTTVSDDIRDDDPITPAHLAIGRPLHSLPEVDETRHDVPVTQRYLYLQRLLDHFWNRWQREYLPSLTLRQKWNYEEPTVGIGDIVLISDDRTKRGTWPLGRVERTYPGQDGIHRTAEVRTTRGILRRPIQRLHLLEASGKLGPGNDSVDPLLANDTQAGAHLNSTSRPKLVKSDSVETMAKDSDRFVSKTVSVELPCRDTCVAKDTCVTKDSRITKESRVSKDSRVVKDTCVPKDSRVVKDTCVPKDSRVSKDIRVAKDSRVSKDSRSVAPPAVEQGGEYVTKHSGRLVKKPERYK